MKPNLSPSFQRVTNLPTCYSEMKRKRSRELDQDVMEAIAFRAAPGIVSIVSHNIPEEMTVKLPGYTELAADTIQPKDVVFFGSGMIIESVTRATGISNSNSQYLSTILAPASLFQHYPINTDTDTNIDIDVFCSSGVSYKAQLLACDFHYNLAAISIISDSPLPTVTLNHIDDTLSIDPTDHLHLPTPDIAFQRQPHSTSFKTRPGTLIVFVWRFPNPPYDLRSSSCSFSSSCPKDLSCKEIYQINNGSFHGHDGGSLLNSSGQVIGILFNYSSFLPSNIVSRWWNHYKSSSGYRRPFVGMEVANLHDADIDFLEQVITRFPKISSAVVVTKVKEDCPACLSGIRTDDVIVKLDGKLIESKLQFYETIWDKVGQTVEVNVLRATDGEELNLSLTIEETSPKNFHQWPHPQWKRIWETEMPQEYSRRRTRRFLLANP